MFDFANFATPNACILQIDSEVFLLSHLRGQSHQDAVKKYEANVKFNENSVITDAPADVLNEKKSREKERQKTLRKRCKKIRQRLSSRYARSTCKCDRTRRNDRTSSPNFSSCRSEKYLKSANEQDQSKKIDSPVQRRILKSIKEIEKLINGQGVGVWANNAVTMLERNLFEIVRVLEKQVWKKKIDGGWGIVEFR